MAIVAESESRADSWRTVGPTNDVRESTGLALLNDGRVLIASGHPATRGRESRWRIIGSAELYDPTTETWSMTGNLVNPRNGIREFAVLADGRVLLAGEHDTRTGSEIYDPKTGVWSATGSLNVGRGVHTTTLLNDGRVLVTGGIDYSETPSPTLTSAEIYHASTGTWTRTGDLHTPRYAHAAVRLRSGEVLIAGGASGDSRTFPALAEAELYDPSTGKWTQTAPMTQARRSHSMVLLADGRALAAGGAAGSVQVQHSLSNAEIYDPATGTWTATAPMARDRAQFPLLALPDGRAMAIAGSTWPRGTALNEVEIFNPANGLWTTTEPLHARRWNHRAVVLHSGDVLVVGGFNITGELTSTEIFSAR